MKMKMKIHRITFFKDLAYHDHSLSHDWGLGSSERQIHITDEEKYNYYQIKEYCLKFGKFFKSRE